MDNNTPDYLDKIRELATYIEEDLEKSIQMGTDMMKGDSDRHFSSRKPTHFSSRRSRSVANFCDGNHIAEIAAISRYDSRAMVLRDILDRIYKSFPELKVDREMVDSAR